MNDTEQLKLEPGESIIRVVRKHWFILLTQTIGIAFGWIAPLLLFSFMFLVHDTTINPFIALADSINIYKPLAFFGAAWTLISWMLLFGVWTDFYLDTWIITTARLIAVDQKGFFRRSVASFRFERLQDLTIEVDGLIPTLLDFGTIKADTASHTNYFILRGIPHPRDIKALIQEHADKVVGVTIERDAQSGL